MFCYKCGKELSDGSVFCSACGTKQKNNLVESTQVQKQSSSKNQTEQKVEKVESPKRKHHYWWVLGALLIVLIGLFGFQYYEANQIGQEFIELENTYALNEYKNEYYDLQRSIKNELEKSNIIFILRKKGQIKDLKNKIESANVKNVEKLHVLYENSEEFTKNYILGDLEDQYKSILEKTERYLQDEKVDYIQVASVLEEMMTTVNTISENTINSVESMKKAISENMSIALYDMEQKMFDQNLSDAENYYNQQQYLNAYNYYSECADMLTLARDSQNYEIMLEQVDTTNYPSVKLYFSVKDLATGNIIDTIDPSKFELMESLDNGQTYNVSKIYKAVKMDQEENLNVALVADCSASMGSDMYVAENAMANFVQSMQYDVNDKAALYSFSDYVTREQYFTSDSNMLNNSIYKLRMGNLTALNDGLVYALSEIVIQEGAKCVIAFTDGEENNSFSSKDYVISKALEYHIPIYIIGIGKYLRASDLKDIAEKTGGFYQNINNIHDISNIYNQIYREQKAQYVLEYTTNPDIEGTIDRDLYVKYSGSDYAIRSISSYVPNEYKINGFIFHDSDTRYLTENELDSLSEAEVRIALNEIYARRGYIFSVAEDMKAHFAACEWYRPIETNMDVVASGFNEFEKANVTLLVSYEVKHGLNGRK